MRRFIRLGDKTSHGGTVTSASSRMFIGGIPVARIGDTCTCPKKGHNSCVIVEGDDIVSVDGRAVATEGCKCSCGAVLISSMPNAGRVYDGGGAAIQAGGGTASMLQNAIASPVTARFDEQLRFVNAQGQPYAEVRYLLHLANGDTAQGQTDAQGNTARITTDEPTGITRAELYYTASTCCARHAEESKQSEASQIVELQGIETNPQDVGTSVAKVTPPDSSRPLTSGEIEMCRLIFKDAINYGQVKVHNHEYLLFGFQDDNTAMTPNGELYFNPDRFQEDFSSTEIVDHRTWFIHEMVHVWQYQLGFNVKWHGILLGLKGAYKDGSAYRYDSSDRLTEKRLQNFNFEQQGELISHHYAATYLKDIRYVSKSDFLKQVLVDFLKEPKNAALLPMD